MVKPCIQLNNDKEILEVFDALDEIRKNYTLEVTVDSHRSLLIFRTLRDWFIFLKEVPKYREEVFESGRMLNLWRDGSLGEGPSVVPSEKGDSIIYGHNTMKYSISDTTFEGMGKEEQLKTYTSIVYRGSKRTSEFWRTMDGFIHRLLQFEFNFRAFVPPDRLDFLFKENVDVVLSEIKSRIYSQEISLSQYLKNIENLVYPVRFSISEENHPRDTMRIWLSPISYSRVKEHENINATSFGISSDKIDIRSSEYLKYHPHNLILGGGSCRVSFIEELPHILYLEHWPGFTPEPFIDPHGIYYWREINFNTFFCDAINNSDHKIPELLNSKTWMSSQESNIPTFTELDSRERNEIILFKKICREQGLIPSTELPIGKPYK